jgi:hypothetical protein
LPKLQVKDQPKKEPHLKPDAPNVHWDDNSKKEKALIDALNDPKTPWIEVQTPRLSPSDLNLKLRKLYGIPLSVNRNHIQPYLNKIENENHKYFLKRYAINGKEFDVCWLLLQEGI